MKNIFTAFVLLFATLLSVHAAGRTFNEVPYDLPEQFSARLIFMQQGSNGVLQKLPKGMGLQIQMYAGKTANRVDWLGAGVTKLYTWIENKETKECLTLRQPYRIYFQTNGSKGDLVKANFPTGIWEYLGTETLNGKPAKTYKVASNFLFGHTGITYKIWVDSATKLPLQGAYMNGPGKDFNPGMDFQYVNFKMETPSSDLFKMAIPSGYKDQLTGSVAP